MGWGLVMMAFAIGVGIGQLNAFLIFRHRLKNDRRLRELDEILKKRREEIEHVENDSKEHFHAWHPRDN